MTPFNNHTALPWKTSCGVNGPIIDANGVSRVGTVDGENSLEDSEFIIESCNSYYTLKEQRDELLNELKIARMWLARTDDTIHAERQISKWDKLIAKAEGRS